MSVTSVMQKSACGDSGSLSPPDSVQQPRLEN